MPDESSFETAAPVSSKAGVGANLSPYAADRSHVDNGLTHQSCMTDRPLTGNYHDRVNRIGRLWRVLGDTVTLSSLAVFQPFPESTLQKLELDGRIYPIRLRRIRTSASSKANGED